MATKKPPVKPMTDNDRLVREFEAYLDRVGAVIEDHLIGDKAMLDELAALDKEFKEDLSEFAFTELPLDKAIEKVKEDAYFSDIVDAFDESDMLDHLEDKGYICIKVDGTMDQQRLKDFVNQNIYPYNVNSREALA